MKYVIVAIILMAIVSGCSSLYDADGGWYAQQDHVGPVPIVSIDF
jgi:hypothetical protein